MPEVPRSTAAVSGLTTFATTDDISVAGYSPQYVALSWAESGDWCFTSYTIQESTNGPSGPWNTIATYTNAGITAMMTGVYSDSSYWFQDIDTSACGGGTATSNVVGVTTPDASSLTYSDIAPGVSELAWTNGASYGGLLSFVSYQIMESINGATETPIQTLSDVSTTSYDVSGLTGLNTGTKYEFQIATTEDCNDCSGGSYPSTMDSNTVTHLALYPPTESVASIDVGESVTFEIGVIGGTSPFSYVWSGLPAGCSSADTSPIECTPTGSGTFDVSVTVTDARGILVVSVPVTVSVYNPNPVGGLFGGGTGSSTLDQSIPWLVLAGLVAAVVVVGTLMVWRKRRAPPSLGAEAVPPLQPKAPT